MNHQRKTTLADPITLDRFTDFITFTTFNDISNDMISGCMFQTKWRKEEIERNIPVCCCANCKRNLSASQWWLSQTEDQRRLADIWNHIYDQRKEIKKLKRMERAIKTIADGLR